MHKTKNHYLFFFFCSTMAFSVSIDISQHMVPHFRKMMEELGSFLGESETKLFVTDFGFPEQHECARRLASPLWTVTFVPNRGTFSSVTQALQSGARFVLVVTDGEWNEGKNRFFEAENEAERFVCRGGQLLFFGSEDLAELLGVSRWLVFPWWYPSEPTEELMVPDAQDPDYCPCTQKKAKVEFAVLPARMTDILRFQASR